MTFPAWLIKAMSLAIWMVYDIPRILLKGPRRGL